MSRTNIAKYEPFERLTNREREAIILLLDGRSNAQIGRALHIAERTVSNHLISAYQKLGTGSRAQLIARYYYQEEAGK